MPLFILTCQNCAMIQKVLLDTSAEANQGLPCRHCDGVCVRTPTAPSLHNKEVLRMGHMIKDVERYVDAEQLYDERAHADYRTR